MANSVTICQDCKKPFDAKRIRYVKVGGSEWIPACLACRKKRKEATPN